MLMRNSVLFKSMVFSAVVMLTAGLSFAASAQVSPEVKAKINKQLAVARPDIRLSTIKPSPVSGFYEATLQDGPMVYVSADGKFLLLGDLFQVTPGRLVNITEQTRDMERRDLIATVKTDDMIVFSPRGETKGVVNVFTDVDCGYCRKLHQEVPALNAKGIEVRYLAYPRAGIGSSAYQKIASAWCADNPTEALTKLKAGQTIATNVCPNNPVPAQFALGGQMGVRGTPAIVLDNGRMLPGYMPADRLAAELGIN